MLDNVRVGILKRGDLKDIKALAGLRAPLERLDRDEQFVYTLVFVFKSKGRCNLVLTGHAFQTLANLPLVLDDFDVMSVSGYCMRYDRYADGPFWSSLV